MAFGPSPASPQNGASIVAQLINDEAAAVVMCTPVYSDGAGTFKKALGDGSAKSKLIGVVIDQSIAAGASGGVLRVGVVTAGTSQWDVVCGTSGGLTYGTLYYLSATVAGALTTSSASGVAVIFGLGPTVGAIVTGGGGGSGTITGVTAGTGLTGGGTSGGVTLALANTTVTPAAYTSANITVDQQGRITTAANGSSGITNGAGANILTKSNGTNIVASTITDLGAGLGVTVANDTNVTGKFMQGSPTFGNPGYPSYFYTNAAYSQNMVVMTEGTGILPTGTDERQAINAFVQGSIDTSAATSASVNAMAYQAACTTTRSGGVKPLNNIAIQANASGGDLNYSFKSAQGTLRNDGPVLLGATTASSFAFDGTNGSLQIVTSNASAQIQLSNTASSITAAGITAATAFQSTGNATFKGEMRLDSGAVDFYMYPTTALSASTQRNIYLSAGGTNGVVRINANTGGIAHTGTGGLEVWPGNNGSAVVGGISGAGMVYGQASADATESLSASGAASIVLGNTFVSGAASNLTLANGSIDGQRKTVTATSGTGQVTPAAFGNGTKMTWSAGGQSCTLVWGATSAKWWLIANVGMTVV